MIGTSPEQAAPTGFVTIVEDEVRFWNGSKIYLCHCKDPKDVYKYQGAEIHVLLIDELTHFLEPIYRFLRSRVRMVGLEIPENFRGKFPRASSRRALSSPYPILGPLRRCALAPPWDLRRWLRSGAQLLSQLPCALSSSPARAPSAPCRSGPQTSSARTVQTCQRAARQDRSSPFAASRSAPRRSSRTRPTSTLGDVRGTLRRLRAIVRGEPGYAPALSSNGPMIGVVSCRRLRLRLIVQGREPEQHTERIAALYQNCLSRFGRLSNRMLMPLR
jgi:hypothetical protein